MSFRPGSFPWLVQHDLKLNFLRFRSMFGGRRPWTIAIIAGAALIAIHLVCWPLASWFVNAKADAESARLYYPMLACAALFVLPWLVSQALMNSTRALYSRGDLDLLLASPIDARVVVAARALAIAIEAIISVGIFLFPIANMNALLGGAHWLAIYPAMLASGLMATAIGLALTVGLFAMMGPRRTRFAAQIAATFIASAFVLGAQIVNVLPQRMRDDTIGAFDHPAPGSIFDPHGLLWLPVRAAMGEWSDLVFWMGASMIAFAIVAVVLGPNFMASAVRSAGGAATAGPARAGRDHRFRAGVGGSLRRKEWRLLARDPWLASQMLLQVIYTLPVSVVIWRSQGAGGSVALAVSPCIVVIASQIAASLAWLAVSSEDAPEFLQTAPVSRAQLERGKIEAVGAPLLILLCGPIIGLAFVEPLMALLTAVIACGAAASTAMLNLWHPMPGKRAQVMRRHSQSKIVGLMEHMMSLCWAVAMVLAIMGTMFAALPVAIVGGILWFNRPKVARVPVASKLGLISGGIERNSRDGLPVGEIYCSNKNS
jgi:ABC-2 type transport system permease protein